MEMQCHPLGLDPGRLSGLSERLIRSHHTNNYGAAVKRLNAIRRQLSDLDWAAAPAFVINGLKREELIAANSASLHELYFDALGGDGVLPPCGLEIGLQRDFGSVQRWRSEFCALAKAMGGGSGWAALSWSWREARLLNHWAADHSQWLAGATPLLVLDMYEHAYHLDFGAQAAAYVEAFMPNLDWPKVQLRYRAAVTADSADLGLAPAAAPTSGRRLIDVRHRDDFAAGQDMAEAATWHDPARLAEWSPSLDPAQPLLLYCVKGMDICRSAALALRLRGLDARFVSGGIDAWRGAGLPLQAKPEGPHHAPR